MLFHALHISILLLMYLKCRLLFYLVRFYFFSKFWIKYHALWKAFPDTPHPLICYRYQNSLGFVSDNIITIFFNDSSLIRQGFISLSHRSQKVGNLRLIWWLLDVIRDSDSYLSALQSSEYSFLLKITSWFKIASGAAVICPYDSWKKK